MKRETGARYTLTTLAAAALLAISNQVAALTVGPFEEHVFAFDGLEPGPGCGFGEYQWTICWDGPGIDQYFDLTVALFEDAGDEEPVQVLETSVTLSLVGVTGGSDYWNDLDGEVLFRVGDGTITFDAFTIEVIVDDQFYSRTYYFTAVPVPGAFWLFASAGLLLGIRRHRSPAI